MLCYVVESIFGESSSCLVERRESDLPHVVQTHRRVFDNVPIMCFNLLNRQTWH